MEHSTTVFS